MSCKMPIDVKEILRNSEALMICTKCLGPMAIGRTGLVCQDTACGGIVDPKYNLDQLREAWPERAIVHEPRQKQIRKTIHRKLSKNDPKLFGD